MNEPIKDFFDQRLTDADLLDIDFTAPFKQSNRTRRCAISRSGPHNQSGKSKVALTDVFHSMDFSTRRH